MTIKKKVLTSLLVLGLSGFAAGAFAHSGQQNTTTQMKSHPSCHASMTKKNVYQHLSDKQKSEIKAIHHRFKHRFVSLRKELKAKRAKLNSLLSQPKVDAKRVHRLTRSINHKRDQLFAAKVKMHLRIKEKVGVDLPLSQ